MESTVTVKVLDVNEPPSFSEVTEIHVPEDRKVGEVIGTVTVEDADLKEQLSFTVTRGYTDFMITNTSCFTEVRLANTHLGLKKFIPFHSQLHFVFTYLSNYSLDMFLKCNAIWLSNTQVSSKCHVPSFHQSGQGTRCVGSLALKHPLDYEAVSILPLTVSVQDSGGLTATHSQMISVDDVNEPPTVLEFDLKKSFSYRDQ